jgi:hypothetical protein
VDDVVAVRVTLESGEARFFMTYGRIQDPVDPAELEAIVLDHSRGFSLGGTPVSARVCASLQEARDEPYFFEALVSFSLSPIPFGDGYPAWRSSMDEQMRNGKQLSYLGRP